MYLLNEMKGKGYLGHGLYKIIIIILLAAKVTGLYRMRGWLDVQMSG